MKVFSNKKFENTWSVVKIKFRRNLRKLFRQIRPYLKKNFIGSLITFKFFQFVDMKIRLSLVCHRADKWWPVTGQVDAFARGATTSGRLTHFAIMLLVPSKDIFSWNFWTTQGSQLLLKSGLVARIYNSRNKLKVCFSLSTNYKCIRIST